MIARPSKAEAERARKALADFVLAEVPPAQHKKLSRLTARWVAASIRSDREQQASALRARAMETDASIFGRVFGDGGIFESVFGKAGAR